ncbi:MAG TPA: nuclear transport factor 2 family protein [Gemmatimonadales bacterium]|nr:nuclear transport factor 2 family protein [Gemmatimonadales bacterium]
MTALLLVLAIVAQNPDSSALVKLEDDWASALVRRDTAVFQRLLAPGFVYSENDQTMTRDEVLSGIVSGSDTVAAAANEDMNVHRFGTTALVTGWLVVRGRGPSGAFERRYRFTDTWMKRGTRWQIVGAHDYLAPKP